MNSQSKYEENIEQEFFWNDNPHQKEKVNKKLTKETALSYLNNIIFAVSHDQKLIEQVKELRQYVRENY